MNPTIKWTRHATERLRMWNASHGITANEVEDALQHPAQIVTGDRGVQVAQTIHDNGLLRVVFVEDGNTRRDLTVYWTSKVDKYWRT